MEVILCVLHPAERFIRQKMTNIKNLGNCFKVLGVDLKFIYGKYRRIRGDKSFTGIM